jgi:hypothetical protein
MAFINDTALDALLQDIQNNAEELHICTQEPTTYAEATATYSKGQKTSVVIAEPSDRSPNGREIVVAAITDGVVDGDGDVTHWALVKASATSRLLATGSLTTMQTVTNGNPFTLASFAVGVPDAVAA